MGDALCPVCGSLACACLDTGTPPGTESATPDGPGLDLDRLDALCREATPGPWAPDDKASFGFRGVRDSGRKAVCGMPENASWPQAAANAAFIAESRTALPALLAEVRRLRAEAAAWRGGVATLGRQSPPQPKGDSMTPIIICAGSEGRAVVFGYVEGEPVKGEPVTLHRARMVLYWPAECKGLFGLAADGPRLGVKLTPEVPSTTTLVWQQSIAVPPASAAAFEAYRG